MLIKRALSVPLPTVWSKFERSRNGKTYKFEIREAVGDEKEKLVEFMCKHFMRDEICNVAFRISEDELASQEFAEMFRHTINYDYNGVCFDITNENEPKFAAANVFMHIDIQKELVEPEPVKSEPMKNIVQVLDMMKNAKNIFETYNVTNYLQGNGMSTDPEYRNLGLASELVLAREPLCRTFGIPLSAASFTGSASQRISEKLGYEKYAALNYEELGRIFNIDFKSPAEELTITAKRITM